MAEREISVEVLAKPVDLTLLAKAFAEQYLKRRDEEEKSDGNDANQKFA